MRASAESLFSFLGKGGGEKVSGSAEVKARELQKTSRRPFSALPQKQGKRKRVGVVFFQVAFAAPFRLKGGCLGKSVKEKS